MAGPIKVFKEDGHYYIKIVNKLPKRGNARILYIIKGDTVDSLYKWNTFDFKYDIIKIQVSNLNLIGIPIFLSETEAINGELKKGDVYSTPTGELRIKL